MYYSNSFNTVPRDVWYNTYLQLDGESIIRCKRVCKWFHENISNFPFWKAVFVNENPGCAPLQTPSAGWEAFYKQQTLIKRNLYTKSHVETIPLAYDSGFILGHKVYIRYVLDIGRMTEAANRIFNLETKEITRIDAAYHRIDIVDTFKSINERYFLISSKKDLAISIWDSTNDKCIFLKTNVAEGIFYINGTHVIYFTKMGFLEIWDYTTNTLIKQYNGTCPLGARDSLVIGNIFFVLRQRKEVLAYDLENGQQKYSISLMNRVEIVSSIIAGENRLVVITSLMNGLHETFKAEVYDSKTGAEIKKISIYTKKAKVVGNKLIALHSWDSFGYWNLETGKMEPGFSCDRGIQRWTTNPDGDRLLVLTPNNMCMLIDLKGCRILCEKNKDVSINGNEPFTFWRKDNHILITGRFSNKDPILFWDITKLQAIHLSNKKRAINFDGSRIFVKRYPNYLIYDLTYVKPSTLLQKARKAIMSIFE